MQFTQPTLHLITALLLFSSAAFAQKSSDTKQCEMTLDEAKMYYESGLLEKVLAEDGITQCADDKHSLSREKRMESFRLLTETHLFKNDIEMADKKFQEILKLNPLFSVDSTDPTASYDLIYLARTYRRKPIVSLYGGLGVNYSRVEVLQPYATDNTIQTHWDYGDIVVGFNGVIGVEIPVWRNFDLVTEVNFLLRTHKFVDSLYTNVDSEDARDNAAINSVGADEALRYGALNYRENQLWLDVPLMVRYNFGEKKVIPYLYAGVNGNFLLNASLLNVQRTTVEEENLEAGNDVEKIERFRISGYKDKGDHQFLSLRNTFNFSVVAGAGVKIRLGRHFLFADLRYTRFFFNMTNPENRYSRPELQYRFNYISSDFRIDALALNVGFMASFYKPMKKRAYDDKVLEFKLSNLLKQKRKLQSSASSSSRELRNDLTSSIKTLEREKRSLLNDVKMGRSDVESTINKARDLFKAGGK